MSERNIVKMIEALRNSQGGSGGGIMVGSVVATSPLTIKTADAEMTKNLYVNYQMQPVLSSGDTVVLARLQDTFYVLVKVVSVS